ncbi:MAG: hypothetical protein JO081_08365 [Alphaproteobacteria bacterium]|nr:hypothetical protein [Alphaproteobacteria bacterium]
MSATIQVIVYGMYGHVYQMREAVAAGAPGRRRRRGELVAGAELVPDEITDHQCTVRRSQHIRINLYH